MTCRHVACPRQLVGLLSFAIMLSALPPVSAQEPAEDADLLLSDSFEEGTKAPDGWKQGAAIPGVRYIYDRTEASDGKRSLSLQKTANRFFPIAAWMRTVDHTGSKPALQMSAKVKAALARKAILDVVFLDANGKSLGHQWIEYIGQKEPSDPPATHDWKEYKGAAEIPAAAKKIVIGLQIYGPGKVWFDELEVRYVDSKDQASSNGSANATSAQDANRQAAATAKEPEPITVRLANNHSGHYLLVEPDPRKTRPAAGFPLLVVLPGGTGTADFHPFVRRIQEQSLDGEFIVAQPLAPRQTVWPTHESVTRPSATTEELVAAVIDDVATRQQVDRSKVYLLAWSSGGPAAFATFLQENSPVAGALIAMSVFKPEQLPSLANARNRSIYLLHSPEDQICPYWMAEAAKDQLAGAAVRTTLVDYDGGHGWHGPVFDQIREGIAWLQ